MGLKKHRRLPGSLGKEKSKIDLDPLGRSTGIVEFHISHITYFRYHVSIFHNSNLQICTALHCTALHCTALQYLSILEREYSVHFVLCLDITQH
jgi:hypothetical protein